MEQPLTSAERDQICLVLRVGCSRAAACEFTGVTPARLMAALAEDAEFAAQVRRDEVQPEVRHMGVVNRAAEDEKNWRTSVWWLEQRRRERQNESSGTTEEVVRATLARFADVVARQIPDVRARHAVVVQLLQLAGEIAAPEPEIAEAATSARSDSPPADAEDAP